MPKVKLKWNGAAFEKNWDLISLDSVFESKLHAEISDGDNWAKVMFISENEFNRFHNGEKDCVAICELYLNGNYSENIELLLTAF